MPGTTSIGGVPYPLGGELPAGATSILNAALALEKLGNMRFTSASDRSTKLPSPIAGMMSWRADGALYEYYTGSAWMPLTASYEALSRSKVMSFIPAAPIAFTSASATNLSGSGTGSFSMSFTKRYAASEIELQVSCVIYAASTSPVPFQVYPVVSFAGTDYKVPASGFTFEIASSYRTVHGIVRVPGGVAAGAYTLQSKIQLAQTGSGRQANMDQFTHFTCRCEEIAVL